MSEPPFAATSVSTAPSANIGGDMRRLSEPLSPATSVSAALYANGGRSGGGGSNKLVTERRREGCLSLRLHQRPPLLVEEE
jgi:hypothetical protein